MKDEDYIHDGNPIVSKLLKLKYRINDVYKRIKTGELPLTIETGHRRDVDTRDDREFVIGLIHNIRKREQNPSKIQLEECNKLWSKYAD